MCYDLEGASAARPVGRAGKKKEPTEQNTARNFVLCRRTAGGRAGTTNYRCDAVSPKAKKRIAEGEKTSGTQSKNCDTPLILKDFKQGAISDARVEMCC